MGFEAGAETMAAAGLAALPNRAEKFDTTALLCMRGKVLLAACIGASMAEVMVDVAVLLKP